MKIYVYAVEGFGNLVLSTRTDTFSGGTLLIGEVDLDILPVKREVVKEVEAERWNDHYVSAILPPDAKNIRVTFTTNE